MNYLNNYFSLAGKTAAVIGGGGVLAGVMAEGLAQAGADVVILDINLENAQEKVLQLKPYGVRASAVKIDASCKADLQRAAATIEKEYGRCDILINAPGVNSTTPFFDITEDEWYKIMDINLKSVLLSCQVFGSLMMEKGYGGSIINISSASSGPPLSKVFTYGVSKAGINNLTQYLAREWASSGIRVNAIAPGFFPAEQNRKILTEERTASIMNHTPMNRFGEPEELIGAVIWLSSEKASSFVTGSIIHIDGGFAAMTI
ncbi:SDR family oxidoreductase [candidate division KSB1 bacterium]|nr:SDR family oxidoreductase [candidate division KSB1 bacterium]